VSNRDFIKKGTGLYNAIELGALEGKIIAHVLWAIVIFAVLSALILGTPWIYVGYAFLLMACVVVFLVCRTIALAILCLFEHFNRK